MGSATFWAVLVAALAVVVNAVLSIVLHVRRPRFEEGLAKQKFAYDVSLAERKATLDYLTAHHQRKQKLAGDILTAFYEVRRIMPAIRSPASWGTEGQSRPGAGQDEPEGVARSRNAYYVVIERISKNRDALARFLSQQFIAMAMLGCWKTLRGLQSVDKPHFGVGKHAHQDS
jgi:hypothetical protein